MREGEPPSQHIAILGFDASSLGKDVITARLNSINMATVGSLKQVPGSKLKFEPLIHTSSQAGLMPVQRFAMMTDPASLRDGFKPTGEFVVAARISGEAASAYANGPPAGVTAAPDALKASSKPLNVVVVADTDLLADFMWVQTRNFFGQTLLQPFANNGELVWNAIDNLSGSADLISIRGRATYSRPFDRVDELRRTADSQLRAKEQELEQQLQQTEEKLSQLQAAQPGGGDAILTSAQAQEIERFREDAARMRKEKRAVQSELGADIESLGMWVKAINVLIVPALCAVLALLVNAWHRRRRHAIAMLRKHS
jgi:ABC-type uncharacterized transport system involved in gliding motility auxiliary subunit